MFLKRLAQTALAAMALTTTSCINTEQNVTINPDGAGKFSFVIGLDMGGIMQGLEAMQGGAGGKMKEDPMQEILRQVIKSSQGVDVWSEAKVEKGADGKSKVLLKGYFKDVTQLKLSQGDDKNMEIGSISSSKDADGNWIIDMGGLDAPKDGAAAEAPKSKLTEAEIKEKIEQMKQQMTMMQGMVEPMLAGAKMEMSITVAGTVQDYGIFDKVDDKTGKLTMKPGKMFAAFTKILDDPAKARVLVEGDSDPMAMLKGEASKKFAKDLMLSMVGKEGAPRMVVKPGAPLFDYEKESAAARENQSAELKATLEAATKPKAGGAGKVKLPKAA